VSTGIDTGTEVQYNF